MKQKYTSKNTSINTITKVYNIAEFKSGDVILDYGGGKYDTNKEHLATRGIELYVYDPYNRTEYHNKEVMKRFETGAEIIVCANVLCVIKEDEVISDILNNIKQLLKPTGTIYVQIYEGNKSGVGKETTKGYQRNRKAAEYREIIKKSYEEDWEVLLKGNIYTIKKRSYVKI